MLQRELPKMSQSKSFSILYITYTKFIYLLPGLSWQKKKLSNKDDNWVIYVVLPVPILGTYYTMYPIF